MEKVLGQLSFQGRANRQRYWLTSLAIVGVCIVCALLLLIPVVGWIAAAVGYLAAMAASLAVSARRLHDRAKSAWWLFAMVLPVTVLSVLSGLAEARDPTVAAALSALTLPFSIWALIELGCLKGTTGQNRFGADPLSAPSDEVLS